MTPFRHTRQDNGNVKFYYRFSDLKQFITNRRNGNRDFFLDRIEVHSAETGEPFNLYFYIHTNKIASATPWCEPFDGPEPTPEQICNPPKPQLPEFKSRIIILDMKDINPVKLKME